MLACVKGAHYRRIGAIVVTGDDALVATAGDDALVRLWPLLRYGVRQTPASPATCMPTDGRSFL